MKLTKRQLRRIIREEKQRLDEIGRRGPVPKQGLNGNAERILDNILELIIEQDPDVNSPSQALRQLRYYLANAG